MLQSPGGAWAGATYRLLVDKDTAVVIESSVIGYILLPTVYPNSIVQMKYINGGKVIFKSELKILQLLFLKT